MVIVTCTRAREVRVVEAVRAGNRVSHWAGETAANWRLRLGRGDC